MHLVLIGDTGSGKTTLARILSEVLKLPRISSGDIAREISASDANTDLALQAGDLAPEAMMRREVKARLDDAERQRNGWVLDGFPRLPAQLILLMQWTVDLPHFFLLDASPWCCIERLTARERGDDNPDAIARRMKSFQEQTMPMINMLDSGHVLHRIGSDMSPDHAADYVLAALR